MRKRDDIPNRSQEAQRVHEGEKRKNDHSRDSWPASTVTPYGSLNLDLPFTAADISRDEAVGRIVEQLHQRHGIRYSVAELLLGYLRASNLAALSEDQLMHLRDGALAFLATRIAMELED